MLGILERIFPSEHAFNSYFVIHNFVRGGVAHVQNSQSSFLDISAVSVYILLK